MKSPVGCAKRVSFDFSPQNLLQSPPKHNSKTPNKKTTPIDLAEQITQSPSLEDLEKQFESLLQDKENILLN